LLRRTHVTSKQHALPFNCTLYVIVFDIVFGIVHGIVYGIVYDIVFGVTNGDIKSAA
jgi:hypothetical protein